ncbi:MAG: antibiotic biosynthesis monooxygenase [Acidimicrobiia bacterium]|nr:antibiotic biosynthesis monooxygenase [Acidimicrobiia bacterium]
MAGPEIIDSMLSIVLMAASVGSPLMIIIYAGTITMDPELRERYIALRVAQMELYRAQPGVLGYAITADAVDPAVVNVFECYDSEAALAAHEAIHERNLEVPVRSYNLYRYDATRSPLIVT